MSWTRAHLVVLPKSINSGAPGTSVRALTPVRTQSTTGLPLAPCVLPTVPQATLFMPPIPGPGSCLVLGLPLGRPQPTPTHNVCGTFLIIFQSLIEIASALCRFPAPLPLHLLPCLPPPQRINCSHILYLSLMGMNRVTCEHVCPHGQGHSMLGTRSLFHPCILIS